MLRSTSHLLRSTSCTKLPATHTTLSPNTTSSVQNQNQTQPTCQNKPSFLQILDEGVTFGFGLEIGRRLMNSIIDVNSEKTSSTTTTTTPTTPITTPSINATDPITPFALRTATPPTTATVSDYKNRIEDNNDHHTCTSNFDDQDS